MLCIHHFHPIAYDRNLAYEILDLAVPWQEVTESARRFVTHTEISNVTQLLTYTAVLARRMEHY